MGKITEAGKVFADNEAHIAAIEAMKNQLLIVLVNRLGGCIQVPMSEIDDTSQFVMMLRLDNNNDSFTFTVHKKQ